MFLILENDKEKPHEKQVIHGLESPNYRPTIVEWDLHVVQAQCFQYFFVMSNKWMEDNG